MEEIIDTEPTPEAQATERLTVNVETAIGYIDGRLAHPEDTKWSVGDLVRLMCLRKDLRGDIPNNIIVGWVDNLEQYHKDHPESLARN